MLWILLNTIIGIILFVLILLLVLLFFPITYVLRISISPKAKPLQTANADAAQGAVRATESLQDEKQKDIFIKGKVRYLFGLLRGDLIYPAETVFTLKVLHKTLVPKQKGKPKQAKADPAKAKEQEKEEVALQAASKKEESTLLAADPSKLSEKEILLYPIPPTPKEPLTGKALKAQEKRIQKAFKTLKKAKKKAEKEKKKAIKAAKKARKRREKEKKPYYTLPQKIEILKIKIRSIYDDFDFYKSIALAEDTKDLTLHLLKRVGKILYDLRPKKIKGAFAFGAADPAVTGYAAAGYAFLAKPLGKGFSLNLNFEEEVLEGDCKIKGHTTLALILWELVLLALDKRLWELKTKLDAHKAKKKKTKHHLAEMAENAPTIGDVKKKTSVA